ncbi:hypothetical protein FOA52_007768 [Chlamydomonas sp. UWO 241]|nr:hypothetical protein FOA52_007768 [Chlamydomonas sp. UWO 241]
MQVVTGIDVTNTESVDRLADGCIDKPLDILINSAVVIIALQRIIAWRMVAMTVHGTSL